MFNEWLQNELNGEIKRRGEFRSLTPSDRQLLNSNDYLGLRTHPKIVQTVLDYLRNGGELGSSGSRLLSGNHPQLTEVERSLSTRAGGEAALLFPSGYQANLAIAQTLANDDVIFFSDAKNHASIIDGLRIADANKQIFAHNNLAELEEQLAGAPEDSLKVIWVESIYSMDGDFAPLEALVDIAEKENAVLVVDEAHATGLFGETHMGRLVNSWRLRVPIVSLHSGGKALGVSGGLVVASVDFLALLVNRARTFIYTTGMSPLIAVAWKSAFEVLDEEGASLRKRLDRRITNFHQELDYLLDRPQNEERSQIIPIRTRSLEGANELCEKFANVGLFVRPIRYPSVARGEERIRMTITLSQDVDVFEKSIQVLTSNKDLLLSGV